YINSDIPPFTTDGTAHSTIQVADQRITHSGGGGGGGGSTGRRSVTVINEGDVPLANLPQPPVNETIILDEDVPLAGLPKTGEIVNAAAGLAAMISTALMGVYLALQKKRRPDQ
ncbi:MAG: doubled motif LPXTG anchor domain-containing protein, partial [Clostridium sp.]|nr:doubled motif LPXTG anchor domain-containing protein [Clostridium sp.]